MFCKREKVPVLNINQQNDKPTQEYQRKYGLEALQQLCLWEKSIIRVSNYKNHRIFTLKCIGQNLIPVSIRLKLIRGKQNISASARKIIERAEKQLMQDRVRGINNTIQASKDNGNQNKTRLASIVTPGRLR